MSAEKSRLVLSQACVAVLILVAVISQSVWIANELVEESLFAAALALTVVGCLGRIWCLAHIAGRKTMELVTIGPYSLCRNPLYLFSFIGVIGVALGTCTLTIPAVVATIFLAFYPSVIRAEERRLAAAHGEQFEDYCSRVPRFFPSLRTYVAAERSEIEMRAFARGLRDALWFVIALFAAHANIELHEAGYGVTLFYLY